jgi:hypothetical protein
MDNIINEYKTTIENLTEVVKRLDEENNNLRRKLELKSSDGNNTFIVMKRDREDGLFLLTHKVYYRGSVYLLKEFCDSVGACVAVQTFDGYGNEIHDLDLTYRIRDQLDFHFI